MLHRRLLPTVSIRTSLSLMLNLKLSGWAQMWKGQYKALTKPSPTNYTDSVNSISATNHVMHAE